MNDLYADTIDWMDRQLKVLERRVPLPVETAIEGLIAYRYAERTAQQAIIQKLARIISGLKASRSLVSAGFLQESAAIARMVDEFGEDVTFLALASSDRSADKILRRYLDAFFAEEESHVSFRKGARVKGRALVSRADITNYVCRHSVGDAFTFSNASLALSHALSGYVHAASPHIMEMFDPDREAFDTGPSPKHPLVPAHYDNLWNHFYRGIFAFAFAAKAVDEDQVGAAVIEFRTEFERRSGDRVDF